METAVSTTENPSDILTWEWCFVVPGNLSIVDMVHPVTRRSSVYGHTLEEIQARYPGAVLMRFDKWSAARGAEQDAQDTGWTEITAERYEEMLCVLPPAARVNGAFLVGEASDHHARTGQPRFACFFRTSSGKYGELVAPITHEQFCRKFGACKLHYS